MKKKLLSLIAGTALLVPSLSMAVGLGSVRTYSGLNQKLNAEIPVLSVRKEGSMSVTLAPNAEFSKRGVQRSDILNSLRFSLVKKKGRTYVRVSSTKRISIPYVNFILQLNTPEGIVSREYAIFLDPPKTSKRIKSKTRKTPVYSKKKTNGQSKSVQPRTQRADRTASSRLAVSSSRGGRYGPVKRGETLWSIAKYTRPSTQVPVRDMVNAIRAANPRTLAGTLPAGVILNIPTIKGYSAYQGGGQTQAVRSARKTKHKTGRVTTVRSSLNSKKTKVTKNTPVKVGHTKSQQTTAKIEKTKTTINTGNLADSTTKKTTAQVSSAKTSISQSIKQPDAKVEIKPVLKTEQSKPEPTVAKNGDNTDTKSALKTATGATDSVSVTTKTASTVGATADNSSQEKSTVKPTVSPATGANTSEKTNTTKPTTAETTVTTPKVTQSNVTQPKGNESKTASNAAQPKDNKPKTTPNTTKNEATKNEVTKKEAVKPKPTQTTTVKKPTPKPTTEKESEFPLIPVAGGGLAALLLGAGGFLALRNKRKKQTNNVVLLDEESVEAQANQSETDVFAEMPPTEEAIAEVTEVASTEVSDADVADMMDVTDATDAMDATDIADDTLLTDFEEEIDLMDDLDFDDMLSDAEQVTTVNAEDSDNIDLLGGLDDASLGDVQEVAEAKIDSIDEDTTLDLDADFDFDAELATLNEQLDTDTFNEADDDLSLDFGDSLDTGIDVSADTPDATVSVEESLDIPQTADASLDEMDFDLSLDDDLSLDGDLSLDDGLSLDGDLSLDSELSLGGDTPEAESLSLEDDSLLAENLSLEGDSPSKATRSVTGQLPLTGKTPSTSDANMNENIDSNNELSLDEELSSLDSDLSLDGDLSSLDELSLDADLATLDADDSSEAETETVVAEVTEPEQLEPESEPRDFAFEDALAELDNQADDDKTDAELGNFDLSEEALQEQGIDDLVADLPESSDAGAAMGGLMAGAAISGVASQLAPEAPQQTAQPVATPAGKALSDDASSRVQMKLDLATSFVSIAATSRARELLNEVMEEGNQEQMAKAAELLERLS